MSCTGSSGYPSWGSLTQRVYIRWLGLRSTRLVPRRTQSLDPGADSSWDAYVGVVGATVGVRRMKTKWGTCKPPGVTQNLAQPRACQEVARVPRVSRGTRDGASNRAYHTEHLYELMDRFMPQWRLYREELYRIPSLAENWKLRARRLDQGSRHSHPRVSSYTALTPTRHVTSPKFCTW